jgi:hypothetical protein
MRKFGVGLLLGAALALLVVSNPSMGEFATFIRQESETAIQKHAGDTPLGRLLSGAGAGLAASYVEEHAQRTTYLVCSLYTIDPDGNPDTEPRWRYLGIADRFVALERPGDDGSGDDGSGDE